MFTNGTQLMVPMHLLEGLPGATDAQLTEVELLGNGYGLHWKSLDVDLSVPGILMGVFGTAKWMSQLAQEEPIGQRDQQG